MANFYIKFDDIQHLDTFERDILLKLISMMGNDSKVISIRINDFLNDLEAHILPIDIKYALSELDDAGIIYISALLDGLKSDDNFEIEFASDSVIKKNAPTKKYKRKNK